MVETLNEHEGWKFIASPRHAARLDSVHQFLSFPVQMPLDYTHVCRISLNVVHDPRTNTFVQLHTYVVVNMYIPRPD